MRRIFYLVTELDPGGAERTLYRLATSLDPAEYCVRVAALTHDGEVGGWLREAGIDALEIGARGWFDLRALGRLTREIKRFDPDILHCFLFHANLAGRIAGRLAGAPVIINSVRIEERRRSHLILDKLTHRLMDAEACVSRSTLEYTHRNAGIPMSKLVVTPNGIDLADFDDIPPLSTDLNIPEGRPLVASVGRLEAQKDYKTMLCAARLVARIYPDVIFAVAGEGPDRSLLEAKARELGLNENVIFLGGLADVRPLLARCDMFAMSSRWEGMPNALMEAMACSKPAVVTNAGGCPELVRDEVNGYVASPAHARELADGIIRLLKNPQSARRMGAESRRIIERDYTLEKSLANWRALYYRLFGGIDI